MRALPRTRSALVAAALLAVLTACSSDELDVDGFTDGACTEVAPRLQEVDEALRALDDELDPREAAVRFQGVQEQLEPVIEAGGEVAEPLQELRQSLGFFRIAVDTDNLSEDQRTGVREALDGVVEACRP